ncbi:MAG: DUF1848 domain-containing protein [Spirochaetes bacterium]|nr:DUF1848 domain-containing protein [Spirochaetota bacterium]
MIISASRRTDIPAYYSEWFLNRIKEGFLLVPNPRNPKQVSRIELSPVSLDAERVSPNESSPSGKVTCIVFWTKNPEPFLPALDVLDKLKYLYYFEFTLTAYKNDIEKNLPPKEKIITTFKQLSSRLGPDFVDWRYDPIIINKELSINWHLEAFYNICKEIHKYTNRCIISFVDQLQGGRNFAVPKEDDIYKLAAGLSQTTKEFNLPLLTCSEQIDLSAYGIEHSSCIDKNKIEKLIGYPIDTKKDSGQRKLCRCIKSVDIGMYNTCKHGCLYCYATTSWQTTLRQAENHNPFSPMLTGSLDGTETILPRTSSVRKTMQHSNVTDERHRIR